LVTLEAGALAFDRTGCQGCLDCLKACPTGARFVYGKFMSAKEVLKIVESDGQFYRRSGGGLTLSGGEAASQAAFAQELLTEARRRHLGTAMETAGHVPWETLRDLTRHLDQILYDIKHFDEDKHKELTGVGLSTILGNLDRLVESFPNLPITVRTPLIPGLNDSYDDLLKIKALVPKRKNLSWEILPYHRMGEAKYAFLGRQYPLAGIIPDSQHLESLKAAVL
jgi:pyruvate formate lyase activating enzyme